MMYRSGFVSLAGRPNVGKSTLINALIGQKIAAVSPRPQMTRKQQLGILTLEHAQIIFMDTPGMHFPKHKLGERMNVEASQALDESDLVLWLVDASLPPQPEDRLLADLFLQHKYPKPVILAINKVDLLEKSEVGPREAEFRALVPQAQSVMISATTGTNLEKLLDMIVAHLPENEAFFPEDQITDIYEREIAADLIREAALLFLRDEVPHSLAIRIDEFKERNTQVAYIAATLFVERESQKPIVIGRNGNMLKKIGTQARKEIERMSGRKVYLELRVKIRKNWRNDLDALRLFGFRSRG